VARSSPPGRVASPARWSCDRFGGKTGTARKAGFLAADPARGARRVTSIPPSRRRLPPPARSTMDRGKAPVEGRVCLRSCRAVEWSAKMGQGTFSFSSRDSASVGHRTIRTGSYDRQAWQARGLDFKSRLLRGLSCPLVPGTADEGEGRLRRVARTPQGAGGFRPALPRGSGDGARKHRARPLAQTSGGGPPAVPGLVSATRRPAPGRHRCPGGGKLPRRGTRAPAGPTLQDHRVSTDRGSRR